MHPLLPILFCVCFRWAAFFAQNSSVFRLVTDSDFWLFRHFFYISHMVSINGTFFSKSYVSNTLSFVHFSCSNFSIDLFGRCMFNMAHLQHLPPNDSNVMETCCTENEKKHETCCKTKRNETSIQYQVEIYRRVMCRKKWQSISVCLLVDLVVFLLCVFVSISVPIRKNFLQW